MNAKRFAPRRSGVYADDAHQRIKLVRHPHANQADELYDLKNDPGETRNLDDNANQRIVRDGMQRRLTVWQQSINDPLLHGKARLVIER